MSSLFQRWFFSKRSVKGERLLVHQNSSETVDFAGVIITVRVVQEDGCEVVIGYPGQPNLQKKLRPGDAVLYQTTESGILEVRLAELGMKFHTAGFLVTQVAPQLGLLAGGVDAESIANSPFDEPELRRIQMSLEDLKAQVRKESFLAPEQFDLLSDKLDEIRLASGRMGRKDWINYVVGTLTTICVSAGFAPDVTSKLFAAANSAFTWLFSSGILLLK